MKSTIVRGTGNECHICFGELSPKSELILYGKLYCPGCWLKALRLLADDVIKLGNRCELKPAKKKKKICVICQKPFTNYVSYSVKTCCPECFSELAHQNSSRPRNKAEPGISVGA